MKNFLKKIKLIVCTGGVSKEAYRNITPMYNENNYKIWKVINIIMSVICIILFCLSFIIERISDYRIVYLIMSIYSTIISVLFFTVVKKTSGKLVKLAVYLSSLSVYAFAISLSAVGDPNELSVTIMVLLVAVPLIILDKPYRLMILNLMAVAAYIILCVNTRPHDILVTEVFHSILYYLVGVVLFTYLVKQRFWGYLEEFKLNEQIHIDALTGLGNELAYLDNATELNNMIKAKECMPFAVCMMDVNNIKTTNDTYGHVFGCALIVETGQYLKKLYSTSRLFHIGGDEFVAVIFGSDYDNLDKVIAKFDKKMENYYIKKEGIDIRLTVARGVTKYDPEKDTRYRDVLERADELMYQNKKEIKEKYNLPQR